MRPFERLLPPKSSVWFRFDQPPFAGPLRYAQGVPKLAFWLAVTFPLSLR